MKLNQLSLIVAASIYAHFLLAQTEFMPVGATVLTETYAFGFSGSSTFYAEKDTICLGLPCKKIKIVNKRYSNGASSFDFEYFAQKGDSIFSVINSPFYPKPIFVFKNKYAVGDSMNVYRDPINSTFKCGTVYIDSVIVQNGITRYASRIVYYPRFSTVLTQRRFNIYDKFLPDFNWDFNIFCDSGFYDGFNYVPLCYSERSIFYKTAYVPSKPSACDSLQRTPNVELSQTWSVFPNPTHQTLTINSSQIEFSSISIYDVMGVLWLQKAIKTPIDLDVSHLPNGVYFLKLFGENGVLGTKKIVIQH